MSQDAVLNPNVSQDTVLNPKDLQPMQYSVSLVPRLQKALTVLVYIKAAKVAKNVIYYYCHGLQSYI
jgi:hypothetical protein